MLQIPRGVMQDILDADADISPLSAEDMVSLESIVVREY